MDPIFSSIVAPLLKLGAPWIMVVVFLALFVMEKKLKEEMSNKLYELGMAVVKSNTEAQLMLKSVEKELMEIRRDIS